MKWQCRSFFFLCTCVGTCTMHLYITRQDIKTALPPHNFQGRVRQKIQRWRMDGLPIRLVRQVIKSISVIELACRPCVVSSFFRTLWNDGPTTSRIRAMSGAPNTQECVLGCRGAEDRLEHYLVCKRAWAALEARPPHGLGPVEISQRCCWQMQA